MRVCFADSYFFIALLANKDAGHSPAVSFGNTFEGKLVTTEWVLSEVGAAMGRQRFRSAFVDLWRFLSVSRKVEIVPSTTQLFARGMELYSERLDKEWSVVDCISFVLMRDRGIHEAVTGDRHFEQAGFTILL